MDFEKFFSWVPKDRAVTSKHEFHFIFFREPLDISRYTAWDEENNVIEPKEIPDPVEPKYFVKISGKKMKKATSKQQTIQMINVNI